MCLVVNPCRENPWLLSAAPHFSPCAAVWLLPGIDERRGPEQSNRKNSCDFLANVQLLRYRTLFEGTTSMADGPEGGGERENTCSSFPLLAMRALPSNVAQCHSSWTLEGKYHQFLGCFSPVPFTDIGKQPNNGTSGRFRFFGFCAPCCVKYK